MIQKTFLFFALLITAQHFAQKQQASPYSFFGMGNNFLAKTVEENMMGATGTALSVPGNLNFSNPAAQTNMRFTTYSLGVINTLNEISDGTNKQRSSLFSLSYLGMGIPLGNKGGITAGLRARTGVGYTLYGENEDMTSDLTFEGSGGASSLFLSAGYQIFKGFSLGAEASYVFGQIEHVVTEVQDGITYDTREKSVSDLRGLEAKLGMFYTKRVGKTKNLNLGLTVVPESTINVTETSSFYKLSDSDINDFPRKTLEPVTVKGSVTTPLNTTMAIAYGKASVWQSSFEYSYNKAQQYTGQTLLNNTRGVVYTDYSRMSFGGYYIPKFNSLTSYFQRVVYRAGIKYEDLGMQLQGNALKDVGISFGVGLPLGKGLTHLNIGAEYGVKGGVNEGLVEEKYFNVRMSISLGDKWFNKRRIN